MALTFGDARTYLAQYAGKGGLNPQLPEVALFTKQVLQYLLFKGSSGALNKFCFHAVDGCFTAPYELEVPLKMRVDGKVGEVWNKWFEWYSASDLSKCTPCGDALFEDPNRYSTVYDIPSCGGRPAALAVCEEDVNTYIDILGVDKSGREIFTYYKGEKISGVRLTLKKGQISTSNVIFGAIKSVVKPETKGYIQLFSISESGAKTFLSDYSPIETLPSYRRFKLTTKCANPCKVTILAKIRIKENYSNNDLIPFDNYYALQVGAQSVNAQYNNNVDVAQVKDQLLTNLLESENAYKRVQPGTPLSVNPTTSGTSIRGIVRRKGWGRGY